MEKTLRWWRLRSLLDMLHACDHAGRQRHRFGQREQHDKYLIVYRRIFDNLSARRLEIR